MGQKRIHQEKTKTQRKVDDSQDTKADHADAEALKAEMDEILDEIDGVLVENAEQFVSRYIQKGGE